MMKRKKIFLCIWVIALFMCMVLSVNASSDTNTAVNEAKNGVLEIDVYYVDQTGEGYLLGSGSGFLIGETSGAEYLITNAHVVVLEAMPHEAKTSWSERFGVDFFKSGNINLKLQVVVKRDVVISAFMVNSSVEMDFAILKLEQPIYDRVPLTINDDQNKVVSTDNVYALGFPGVIEEIQDANYYTSDDVNVTNGIVSKLHTIDSVLYVQHSASISAGNSGGPLLNSRGEVIAVNMGSIVDTYYYSVHISEVTSVLRMLGIQFVNSNEETAQADEAAEEPETVPVINMQEPEITVDKSELSSSVASASNLDTTVYSDESILDLVEAIAEANSVINNPDATQTEVSSALRNLETARNSLVEKSRVSNSLIIIIVIALIVIIAAVIIVIVMMNSKKKRVEPTPKPTYTTPGAGAYPGRQGVQSQSSPGMQFHTGMDSGAGETSVLNDGAGETSVLNAGMGMISASLSRRKNGENIAISKQAFKLGKERAKVDYCIPDNSSISRHHASIVYKGGSYYIIDKNSTNFTFVNGNKISAEQEFKLNSGDKIKLSDEEFEFRC